MKKTKQNWQEVQRKPIVVEEHTLGVPIGEFLQVLRTSVIKSSWYSPHGPHLVMLTNESFRLATKEDFNKFNVHAEGYFKRK